MDRPEHVEVNPVNRRVYMVCTNNTSRDAFRGPGVEPQPSTDSIFAVPTSGPFRGEVKRLVNGVLGGEFASLLIGPASRTLFLSIQHPGEGAPSPTRSVTGRTAATSSPGRRRSPSGASTAV